MNKPQKKLQSENGAGENMLTASNESATNTVFAANNVHGMRNEEELTPAQMAEIFLRNNIFGKYAGMLYWFQCVYVDNLGAHGYYLKVDGYVLQNLRQNIYSMFGTIIDAYRSNATRALDNVIDFLAYKSPCFVEDFFEKSKLVFLDGIFCDISSGCLRYGYLKTTDFSSKYLNMLGCEFMRVQGYPSCLKMLSEIEWPENPTFWAQCVLEQLGYIFCGSNVEKAIPAWRGATNSFKSTLFNSICSLWNVNEIFVQDIQSFGKEFGADNLEGARVAYFPDIQEGRPGAASVSKIKQLSGNDPSRINTKFKDGRTGNIDIPIMIISNGPIMLGDSAAERRCVYTPFPVSILDQTIILNLVHRFQAESAILIKAAVEAHARRILERRPLSTPWPLNSYVDDDSAKWQDRLWKFVRNTLTPSTGQNVSKGEIYSVFCDVLRSCGIKNIPNYMDFCNCFNGVFRTIFPDSKNALRQVRDSYQDTVKGIYNFSFRPENYEI